MKPALNAAVGSRFKDRLIAISLSEAEDTEQLGFPANQLDRVLEAVLTPLVGEGARVAYGGRIELPEGMTHNYTLEIASLLGEAYRRFDVVPGERPFVHFIAQHRLVERTDPAEFLRHLKALAPYGECWLMDATGVAYICAYIGDDGGRPRFVLRPHPAGGATAASREFFSTEAEWLTTQACRRLSADVGTAVASFGVMRETMTVLCDARVAVGGRFTGFLPPMPGLADEVLRSVVRHKPLAVLGGFGGSARDIAIALGLLDDDERVSRPKYDDDALYQTGMKALENCRVEFSRAYKPHLSLLQQLAAEDSVVSATSGLIRYLLDVNRRAGLTVGGDQAG